jgi:aminoglycoside 6'-N-acetyltransferase I
MSMAASSIRMAQRADRDAIVEMRALLWPESSREEQAREFDAWVTRGKAGTFPAASLPAAILVSQDADGTLTGFLEVSLRSHADGCDIERPVGYVEGWFVREGFRGRGIGAELMRASEDWARGLGCIEMASDALIDNEASQNAHQALGFAEVDRCVHFRKNL